MKGLLSSVGRRWSKVRWNLHPDYQCTLIYYRFYKEVDDGSGWTVDIGETDPLRTTRDIEVVLIGLVTF